MALSSSVLFPSFPFDVWHLHPSLSDLASYSTQTHWWSNVAKCPGLRFKCREFCCRFIPFNWIHLVLSNLDYARRGTGSGGGKWESMESKAPSCGHIRAVPLSVEKYPQLITKQKHAFCLKYDTFSIWCLIFVIYIHDEIWHLCFRCHLLSCSSASINISIIKSATTTENTLVKFKLCLCPALGASWGKIRCARQGRGHATARGPASPHSVPAAPTSGHAGRQQSGTLGALQKHSMYREVYMFSIKAFD